jgi:hypothetical protein
MCMYMLLLIFGFLHKKNKKYIYTKKNTYIDIYIYIYILEGIQKIKGVRKGCWNAHKIS